MKKVRLSCGSPSLEGGSIGLLIRLKGRIQVELLFWEGDRDAVPNGYLEVAVSVQAQAQ